MRRFRGLPIVLMALGALLAVAAGAELWVGLMANDVANLVRPEMTDQGLAQHRSDFESARTVFNGMNDQVLPAVAAELGESDADLRATIDRNYPAVSSLLAQREQIVPFAEQSLTNLEKQQHNFEQADSLPGGGLPPYSGAALDFAFAAIIGGAGIALARTHRRGLDVAMAGLVGAVAVAMVVLPLALQVPSKSSSAQSVLDSLNPSTAVVQRTNASIATANAAAAELDQRLFPDLAAALGMTRPQFDAAIASAFPDVGAGLQDLPAVMARYNNRLAIREGGASDLRILKRLPLRELGWFGPAFGVVLGGMVAWWALAGLSVAAAARQNSGGELLERR